MCKKDVREMKGVGGGESVDESMRAWILSGCDQGQEWQWMRKLEEMIEKEQDVWGRGEPKDESY